MHMGLRMLEGEAFDKTVEMHKVIGTPYLIVASLPKKNLASVQAGFSLMRLSAAIGTTSLIKNGLCVLSLSMKRPMPDRQRV